MSIEFGPKQEDTIFMFSVEKVEVKRAASLAEKVTLVLAFFIRAAFASALLCRTRTCGVDNVVLVFALFSNQVFVVCAYSGAN